MVEPSDTELRQRYEQMETYDLLRIAAARPEDYTPRAVEIAREVVERRSTKTDPEILFELAEERAKESEGFWEFHDRQRGKSMRAGFLAMVVVLGIGFVGVGIEELVSPVEASDPSYVWAPILAGTGILALCIVAIMRIKRRQAERANRERLG
jgi:hypothetical protein